MRTETKLVKQFDKDADKRLNAGERKEAMEFLKKEAAEGRGRRGGFPGGRRPGGSGGPGGPGGLGGFGPPPGMGGGQNQEPPKPGIRIAPTDVKAAGTTALYAPDTLRTLFFQFENDTWEAEMEAFHDTDVEVPATLTVDGKEYPGVGVHFRGMSSFMMVRSGRKRSLNVALDFTDSKQRLDGYKTLNLLNSNGDETMMSTVLYSEIARHYIPAPKANFVRVVINGENWGVYGNVQQFNKDFVQEHFRTGDGARWKVSGSPMGGGGLDYLGEDIEKYKAHYDLKSKDNEDDWKALIQLCRTLQETPADKLEEALKPMLDIDGLLWFLALDCTLINTDGYWIRASDYSIYRDKEGKFHILPHDMNEAFTTPHGPGMGGGPGGRGGFGSGRRPSEGIPGGGAPLAPQGQPQPPAGEQAPRPQGDAPRGPGMGGGIAPVKGVELDPLVGLDDPKKPLRSRILAVPALRARYLANVRTLAEQWLDWKNLGPLVAKYRTLIEKEVEIDTRKMGNFAAFQKLTADTAPAAPAPEETTAEPPQRRGPSSIALRAFAEQRRAFLLGHPEVKKAAATAGTK